MSLEFLALDYLVSAVARIEKQQSAMSAQLRQLTTLEQKQMATIEDILSEAKSGTTIGASVVALVRGLAQQVADATAGAITPEVQAKIDEVFATITANDQALADVVTANTPHETPAP